MSYNLFGPFRQVVVATIDDTMFFLTRVELRSPSGADLFQDVGAGI